MDRYTKTDQQLHFLSQLIAKANRSFHPAAEDDSHTNMAFDALGQRLHGRWLQAGAQKLLFTLDLPTQALEIINDRHQVQFSIQTTGETMATLEEAITAKLPDLGLDPTGYAAAMHYEIPEYDFAAEPIARIEQENLEQWMHFRQLANEASVELLHHAQVEGEVRIWPHHFDTGIYAPMNDGIGIGFGLAMEDTMAGAPYFYISGYPSEGELNYSNPPEYPTWQWETGEHWKGAYLTITTLKGKAAAEQKAMIRQFISDTFHWFISQ